MVSMLITQCSSGFSFFFMQLCTTRHAMMIQKLHLISVKWSLICLKIHKCFSSSTRFILLMRSSFHFWQLFIFFILCRKKNNINFCLFMLPSSSPPLLVILWDLLFAFEPQISYSFCSMRLCVLSSILFVFFSFFSHLISALHLLLFSQLILMDM